MMKCRKLTVDAFPVLRAVTAARMFVAAALVSMTFPGAAPAQETAGDDAAALAQRLANPIASLISVPIQFNYDSGFGPDDGDRVLVNIQPVIPFDLTENLSLVTRTILPVVWQDDIAGPSGDQFGLGDTLQSFFLVPNPSVTALGTLTYGVGTAITWPTSTDRLIGSGPWAWDRLALPCSRTAPGLSAGSPGTNGASPRHAIMCRASTARSSSRFSPIRRLPPGHSG